MPAYNAERRSRVRQLGWFVLLWAAGVATVLILALLLRLILRPLL